jgi:hypothetical protein
MRRAWDEMKLDGILCFDRIPVVYFKHLPTNHEARSRVLHRQIWNQGIAPLLVIITPTQILAYSALVLPARDDDSLDSDYRLVTLLNRANDAVAVSNFIRRIELGDLFREKHKSFDPTKRVDRYLLENLGTARLLLQEKVDNVAITSRTIHAILSRVIFICYLVDRDIINESYFASIGATSTKNLRELLSNYTTDEAKKLLYALFAKLRLDFHGDIFDADLDAEQSLIFSYHISVLRTFLRGDDLRTGQITLGFWAYDFRFIPIETISAIYERFLEENRKRQTGAYYTPRFLAELVLDSALDHSGTLLDKKILDPACGSGIFLVGVFTRMAEEWRVRNPTKTDNDERAAALSNLLTQNIFGVDLNETACRIAALSLYLAFLDQLHPRNIQKLQQRGRALPKLVAYPDEPDSAGVGKNIFHLDFFDEQIKIPDDFDFVVGNPPWARAKGPETPAEAWCDEQELPIAQRQIAYAFTWKAPVHLRVGGKVCFVLPAAVLFNHQEKSLAFQECWFSKVTVESILNLSDLCFYLFDGADRPAVVVRYNSQTPKISTLRIPYSTPKTDYEVLNAEILTISHQDTVEIRLAEVIYDLRQASAPLAWKKAMWATPRGIKFLDRLQDFSTLADRLSDSEKAGYPWVFAEGFNPGGAGEAVDRPILHKLPFLPTGAVKHYFVARDQARPEPPLYDPKRGGNEQVYHHPHLLFPHGVSRKGKRIKAAFSSFDCSFEHSLRGIYAPTADEDQLRFLACALASPLALYYFFHTAANWGTERAKIHVKEYGRFPFPRADTRERRTIIKEIAAAHRHLQSEVTTNGSFVWGADTKMSEAQELFDGYVYQYYGVDAWERWLIDDTVNYWIRSATPTRRATRIPALQPSTAKDRELYSRILLESLSDWAVDACRGIRVQTIMSAGTNLAVQRLTLGDGESRQVDIERNSFDDLQAALTRTSTLLRVQSGSIRHMRDLKVFDNDDLYLIKPLAQRYWTATAALNDADEILGAIWGFDAEPTSKSDVGVRS